MTSALDPIVRALVLGAGFSLCIGPGAVQSREPVAPSLELANTQTTEDLAAMLDRRLIRVLVSFSDTEFFLDDELDPRGFEFELMQKYAEFLNEGLPQGEVAVSLVFLPVPFERLIPDLLDGKGDIVASQLTVTEERSVSVAFSDPYLREVTEVVVSNRTAPTLTRLEDLAGRKVHVVRGSSYAEHLGQLNARFQADGLATIKVIEVDENLATEDVFELVNAGIFEHTVADRHLATVWHPILDSIRLDDALVVKEDGRIAWGVRPGNPELLASLNRFVGEARDGTLLGNVLFERYYEDRHWITNPLEAQRRARFENVAPLFEQYGDRYGFDPLALVAVAYQESGLDQSRQSQAGAVGIMQIKPSTAADDNIGIEDIHQVENNIHAGTKYLAFLRDRYFSDSGMEPAARVDFTLAAYNAGPARIRKLRGRAQAEGLDPNQWFGNVELVARKTIGPETVRYVRNIHKYYVAYSLYVENRDSRDEALTNTR